MPNITNIPAPRVPFIDDRTGLMSREWYRFFLNLFTITTESSSVTVDDLLAAPLAQSTADDIAAGVQNAQLSYISSEVYSAISDALQQAQLSYPATQPTESIRAVDDGSQQIPPDWSAQINSAIQQAVLASLGENASLIANAVQEAQLSYPPSVPTAISAAVANLAGGSAGSLPYQTAADTTGFLAIGTAAQVLQVNAGATAPEWVSSTGTGNVVRATSPTLVTPNIGSATASSIQSTGNIIASVSAAGGSFNIYSENLSSAAVVTKYAGIGFLGRSTANVQKSAGAIVASPLDSDWVNSQVNILSVVSGGLFVPISFRQGVLIGSPAGGDMGAGTCNFENDIYKNGTAYTNPDYVLEHWATGGISKFAHKNGAKEYDGLKSLEETERFTREKLHLPRFGQNADHGMFSGSDAMLASLEEAYIHIFRLNNRIKALEAKIQ